VRRSVAASKPPAHVTVSKPEPSKFVARRTPPARDRQRELEACRVDHLRERDVFFHDAGQRSGTLVAAMPKTYSHRRFRA